MKEIKKLSRKLCLEVKYTLKSKDNRINLFKSPTLLLAKQAHNIIFHPMP